MDIGDLSKLIMEISESSISDFKYEDNEIKVRMIKHCRIENMTMENNSTAVDELSCSIESTVYHEVLSEYVGIVKLLDKETLRQFINVGMNVNCGDLLFKIEYLNIMIDITSDYSGIISEICVENNTFVDYGKKILVIAT